MVVTCDASDDMEYRRTRSELSNAALHVKQDANGIEKKTLKLRHRHRLTLAPLFPFWGEVSIGPTVKVSPCVTHVFSKLYFVSCGFVGNVLTGVLSIRGEYVEHEGQF